MCDLMQVLRNCTVHELFYLTMVLNCVMNCISWAQYLIGIRPTVVPRNSVSFFLFYIYLSTNLFLYCDSIYAHPYVQRNFIKLNFFLIFLDSNFFETKFVLPWDNAAGQNPGRQNQCPSHPVVLTLFLVHCFYETSPPQTGFGLVFVVLTFVCAVIADGHIEREYILTPEEANMAHDFGMQVMVTWTEKYKKFILSLAFLLCNA